MALMTKRSKNQDPAPEVVPTPVPSEGFVTVTPVHGAMTEPFQRIVLHEGQETPVKMTSWVESQIAAGLLRSV